jgi:thiol-disulfide isomerase/thioredoxin
MILRRNFVAVAILAAVSVPALAMSSAFTSDSFMAAQKGGKSLLVDVSAPWCPVCKAQQAVLGELGKQERFKSIVTLKVDFDSQKDALKALKADKQSTLIVFKGDKEVGRVVGETKKEAIEALLAKAL